MLDTLVPLNMDMWCTLTVTFWLGTISLLNAKLLIIEDLRGEKMD